MVDLASSTHVLLLGLYRYCPALLGKSTVDYNDELRRDVGLSAALPKKCRGSAFLHTQAHPWINKASNICIPNPRKKHIMLSLVGWFFRAP